MSPKLLAKPFHQENVTFLFIKHGYFFPYVLNEAEAFMMKVLRLLCHTKKSYAFRKVCLELLLPNQNVVFLKYHSTPVSTENVSSC